jgi:hypothetical protein
MSASLKNFSNRWWPIGLLPITRIPEMRGATKGGGWGSRVLPGFLAGARSEKAKRAVDARKTTKVAAVVVVHYGEPTD